LIGWHFAVAYAVQRTMAATELLKSSCNNGGKGCVRAYGSKRTSSNDVLLLKQASAQKQLGDIL
jgi:hypothetical protein